jgi:type I restriction enzyme R subunit
MIYCQKDIIKEAGPVQDIVHGVVKAVKNNLQIDWMSKEDKSKHTIGRVKKEQEK